MPYLLRSVLGYITFSPLTEAFDWALNYVKKCCASEKKPQSIRVMIFSKEFNSAIFLTVTSIKKAPKRNTDNRLEKFFIVTCCLLVALGSVASKWLLVLLMTGVAAFWSNVATPVLQLAQNADIIRVLVAIALSVIIPFFLIKLVQMTELLFQAFWDSLQVN